MLKEPIFFTVGPTKLYPTVKKHILNALKENISSISHRSEKFINIFKEVVSNLKKLLNIPADYEVFFLSSATEAMERIIENTVEKNSFHLVSGDFGHRFFQIASDLKKQALYYQINPNILLEKQKFTLPKKTELITITQNETSIGYAFDPKIIYQIKSNNPDKLIAVDIVSSSPYINLDFKRVDLVFFSVQKGFGLPAGLSVLIISPQAFEKSVFLNKKNKLYLSYHNFLELKKYALKNQTPETPNVLALYLLNAVIKDFLKIGIEKIRKKTEKKAKMIYDFLEKSDIFEPYVKIPSSQSKTTIVAQLKNGKKNDLILEKLKKQGLYLSKGYKNFSQTHLRIANFPAHNFSEIKQLISFLKVI